MSNLNLFRRNKRKVLNTLEAFLIEHNFNKKGVETFIVKFVESRLEKTFVAFKDQPEIAWRHVDFYASENAKIVWIQLSFDIVYAGSGQKHEEWYRMNYGVSDRPLGGDNSPMTFYVLDRSVPRETSPNSYLTHDYGDPRDRPGHFIKANHVAGIEARGWTKMLEKDMNATLLGSTVNNFHITEIVVED